MKLQGVLDNSLGNFTCLRGYAPMGDLYRVSAPDASYQRNLIGHQQERMEKFLDDGKYLFFPEVILGASIGDMAAVSQFREEFHLGNSGKYKFTQFKLNYYATKTQSRADTRNAIIYRRAEINIDEKLLKTRGFSKFHRIDGNHRLSILSDDLSEPLTEEKIQRYSDLNVPFCVLLFNTDEELNKFSRALFHNLNYKQIALTMEQNLKLILEDVELFSNEELFEKFGANYLLSRTVLNSWNLSMIPNVEGVIDSEDDAKVTKRTFLFKTFELLNDGENISNEEIKNKANQFLARLSSINEIYSAQQLGHRHNEGLLSAFVYYAYQAPLKLEVFKNWVLENHIYQTDEISALEIIKIFNCVLEARKRTIFVSMPFVPETEKSYQAIKDAVSEINSVHSFDLKIREIRIDQFKKGYSYKIDDEILTLIEDSGLMLADVTLGNKNVYHEIGYLMGLNQQSESGQNNFVFFHNAEVADADFDKDHGFNIKSYQVLVVKDTNELRKQITSQIKRYYHIGEG